MLFGKYVNRFYSKYWYLFLIGVTCLVLVDYFQLLIPEIYGNIINELKENTLFSDDNTKLVNYCLQLLGVGFIMFFGRFGWRNTVFGCGINVASDLRDDLYKKALKLDQEYYKEAKVGGILSYFTNDLEVLQNVFGEGTILIVDAFFLGLIAYIKMLRLSVKIALFALIPLLIIFIGSFVVEKFMKTRFKKRQDAYEKLSDFANENFEGLSVIKAFVKEDNQKVRFDNINKENMEANLNFVKFSIKINVLFTFFLNVIAVILIYFSSEAVLNKVSTFAGKEFNVGNMSELISYFNTLIWPMFALSELINLRAQGKASLNRISTLLDTPIRIKDRNIEDSSDIKGDILFNNLSFNYPDSKIDTLHNINLHIKQGEFVGIIGKTGSGKSTFVDILLRTYNIKENELFIDGIDIMHLPYKKVRDAIGYVPQDNFLFSDTISNNIAFAYDSCDMEQVELAAREADVEENILNFKDKYGTILGERGVTLSGGQKQRVSIARALIKDPQILILDDSLSAVDTKTEEEILTTLKSIRQNKTTIIISHRISCVKDLDKIVVLNNGYITGCGTHEELLKENTEYSELARLQSLEKSILGGDVNEK